MPETQVLAINYSRDAGWAGSVIAELCRGLPSTVIVTFSDHQPPELGVYRAALPDDFFANALKAVSRSGYQNLPVPEEYPPESRFITIGERRQGEDLPILKPFDLRAVPPAVATLASELDKFVTDIRRHPERTIRGAAAWTQPVFDPGEPLAIRLTLESMGTLPVGIGNPLGVRAGTWNGVRLWLRDVAGKEQSIGFEVAHLRPAPGASQGAVALLIPGTTLGFDIKKKVYLTPGEYMGRLSYQNAFDVGDDPQFINGELVLDLGRVTVARARGAR